jgi:ribosomal protein S18 acetylase RimI-like enzyme
MTSVSIQTKVDAEHIGALALPICRAIFSDFDERYLLDRLIQVADPLCHAAFDGARPVGFKLGYRRGEHLFYSWLGGVLPEARGLGVARQLMTHQHRDLAAAGYRQVATRTRAGNNAMIVLNLRSEFQICGYETYARGFAVVTQRKTLQT